MYQELKTYKHSPEVRAAMALLQREFRARRKQKAEGAKVCGPNSNSPKQPTRTREDTGGKPI
jgi:hypothetical protein